MRGLDNERSGILFYASPKKKRANEKFEKILQGYDMLGIKCVKFIKLKEQMSAYFENGDCWKLLLFQENTRADKMNIAYVPREPDPNALMLIKARTTCLPYNGVIHY